MRECSEKGQSERDLESTNVRWTSSQVSVLVSFINDKDILHDFFQKLSLHVEVASMKLQAFVTERNIIDKSTTKNSNHDLWLGTPFP